MAILRGLALSLHIYIYSVCVIAREIARNAQTHHLIRWPRYLIGLFSFCWYFMAISKCCLFLLLPNHNQSFSPFYRPESNLFPAKIKELSRSEIQKYPFVDGNGFGGCYMSTDTGLYFASDPPVDKQPDGGQRWFAGRHSLFFSFAWVELDLARRSSLEAGIKSIRRDLECVRLKAGLQSHPSPPPPVGTSHLHITRFALFSFAFVSRRKLRQPSKDDIS